jgi:hypothetical protein
MDDALTMGLGDPQGHLLGKPRCPQRGPGRAIELLVQAALGNILELEERQTIGLADVADLDNTPMREPGDRLGFGHEPGYVLGAGMSAGEDHLEGAFAVQANVACLVNHAHAAAAQLARDFVSGHCGCALLLMSIGPVRRDGC